MSSSLGTAVTDHAPAQDGDLLQPGMLKHGTERLFFLPKLSKISIICYFTITLHGISFGTCFWRCLLPLHACVSLFASWEATLSFPRCGSCKYHSTIWLQKKNSYFCRN